MSVRAVSTEEMEVGRRLLCALQDYLLAVFLHERNAVKAESLQGIVDITEADTIYQIDKVSEHAILEWFSKCWPEDWPVQIVMEGLIEGQNPVTFPSVDVSATRFKCIIDPIDGTRPIMYDKRSAWALAGLATQRGPDTSLHDVFASAMTELPTSKQWRSDQLSAVTGGRLFAESINVFTKERAPLIIQPSRAANLDHGFAALNRFFPEGLELLAAMEGALWRRLKPDGQSVIFTDQYLTTGGQLYELMAGRDRFIADLRPWVFRQLGMVDGLTCHPYDMPLGPVVSSTGIIVEDPISGEPVDAPLDTTSWVGWAGYANAELRSLIHPHLLEVLREYCPRAS